MPRAIEADLPVVLSNRLQCAAPPNAADSDPVATAECAGPCCSGTDFTERALNGPRICPSCRPRSSTIVRIAKASTISPAATELTAGTARIKISTSTNWRPNRWYQRTRAVASAAMGHLQRSRGGLQRACPRVATVRLGAWQDWDPGSGKPRSRSDFPQTHTIQSRVARLCEIAQSGRSPSGRGLPGAC